MGIDDALKSDVLRPITTLIVPGAIAIAPFVLLVGYYTPVVYTFWKDHPSAFVTIVGIAIFASGLVLDNLGSHLEVRLYDYLLAKTDPQHEKTWDRYLGLRIKDELVGQRYLKEKVERLKFERSMGPAMLSFAVGLTWLQCLNHVWRWPGFAGLAVLLVGGSGYFVREGYKTACVLARTRKLILAAVDRTAPN